MSFSGGGNEEHLRSWSLYGMVVFVCAGRCAGLGGAESGRAGWRRVRMARARVAARRQTASCDAEAETRKGKGAADAPGCRASSPRCWRARASCRRRRGPSRRGCRLGDCRLRGSDRRGSPPEGRARRGQGCAASDAGSPLANLRRNKKNFIPRQSTPPSVGVLTKVTALPLGPRKTLCRRPPACASTQCVCCGRLAAKVARPRGRSL